LFANNDSPYFGFCRNVDEADDLVQEYSYRTSASFAVSKATKDFGRFDFTGE